MRRALALFVLSSAGLAAAQEEPEDDAARPTIGLVLSGGGARSCAHVGVLEVLEDLRLGVVDGKLRLPAGLIEWQRLDLLLRSLTAPAALIDRVDDFPRPFRAVATDLETGACVVLDSGDLPTAVRASMSIPGLFSPVERDGRLLVDGGLADNVPVDAARAMGADVVIVVDLSRGLSGTGEIGSAFTMLNRVLGFGVEENSRVSLESLGPRDIVIRPVLEGMGSAQFERALEAADSGVAAARECSDALRSLALSPAEYARHRAARARPLHSTPFIDEVRVVDDSDMASALIRERTARHAGRRLDVATLEDDLAELYGIDQHATLRYAIVRDGDRTILAIVGRRRDWGSTFLRFGVNGQSDLRGVSDFNGATSSTSTALNALGGEWRTVLIAGSDLFVLSELYQPLDLERRWFLAPWVRYEERNVGVFDEDQNRIAELRPSSGDVGLRFGRNFGHAASLQGAVYRGSARSELLTGDPTIDATSADTGGVRLFASWDELDELDFPSSGALAVASWDRQLSALGADVESELLNLAALWAASAGRHSLLLWTDLALTLANDVEESEPYALGGLFSLSGTPLGALSGANAGAARAIYRWQISDALSSLGFRSWVGASLEIGDVWPDHGDVWSTARVAGSVLYAIDTPLGPIYLGAGLTEGGASSIHVAVGRTFGGGLAR